MQPIAISNVELELIKAALTGGIALVTLGLGWLVGQRLTHHWAIRQKRRESELSAANEFFRLYGEFFAVWKLWNYSKQGPMELSLFDSTRWELLKRAASAEAGIEAILVKLASERILAGEDISALGRFRQGYQRLREAIRDDEVLDWWYQDHPEYASFKQLASRVATMISSGAQSGPPKVDQAQEALRSITSGRWESDWVDRA